MIKSFCKSLEFDGEVTQICQVFLLLDVVGE